jgi:hypothetical protein
MHEPTIEVMAERFDRLAARCDRLEGQARRWKTVGGSALVGVVLMALGGAQRADGPKVIEAERIVLKDGNGVQRVVMAADIGSGPNLSFFEADGKIRLGMGRGPFGATALSLSDKKGKGRITIQLDQDDRPSINVLDKDGLLHFMVQTQ